MSSRRSQSTTLWIIRCSARASAEIQDPILWTMNSHWSVCGQITMAWHICGPELVLFYKLILVRFSRGLMGCMSISDVRTQWFEITCMTSSLLIVGTNFMKISFIMISSCVGSFFHVRIACIVQEASIVVALSKVMTVWICTLTPPVLVRSVVGTDIKVSVSVNANSACFPFSFPLQTTKTSSPHPRSLLSVLWLSPCYSSILDSDNAFGDSLLFSSV